MNESKIRTLEQVRQYLGGTADVRFAFRGDHAARYAHIAEVLRRFGYARRKRDERGLLLRCLGATTGYASAQVKRLVARFMADEPLVNFARHWHDVTRRDAAGFVDNAAADRALAQAVAAHKSIVFAESTPEGEPIDYRAAVTGALALASSADARRALAEDYQRMVEDGLLLDDAEPFDVLLQRCQALADKVNAAVRVPG